MDTPIELALSRILTALGALCMSKRWINVVRPALLDLDAVDEIVCYALGCVEDPNVPWQVALLVLLANALEVPEGRRLVYDPCHGPHDLAVLKICGFTSLGANERAERKVHAPTLFFMPFAPYTLTDNVLRANWGQLHQIAVIGNALRWVADPGWDRRENSGGGEQRWQRLGRAPCTETVLSKGLLENEIVLWEGDMRTWLTADEEGDSDRMTLHSLNATLTTFCPRGDAVAHEVPPPRGKPWPATKISKL